LKLAKLITSYMALLMILGVATSARAQSDKPHFFSHHKVHFFSHHKAHFFPHQGPPSMSDEPRHVYYHRSGYDNDDTYSQEPGNDKPHFFSHHKSHFFSHHKAHFFPHQ